MTPDDYRQSKEYRDAMDKTTEAAFLRFHAACVDLGLAIVSAYRLFAARLKERCRQK